ncbi:GIY-YIG nuclease family protein [Liquorilactobacillus mali]|uniref:GIY-YIG nuclease family protein n=1 Tax=Liquorilactobacillus mali TaxID=1618 RepID=UPI0029555401|nr:GIY-YIG nuclease family protein [Liquorilactobacillus mali]MDV7758056.1 GIY-YIG nuclease family protein [Liquorilactobacillus mali]
MQKYFDSNSIKIIIFTILLYAFVCFILYSIKLIREDIIANKIYKLANQEDVLTPHELLELHKKKAPFKRQSISTVFNFPGVYIIHNLDQDIYYVGQGRKVLDRASQHFRGHGNGDVYADYKYGDDFVIQFISLDYSGYSLLLS